MISTVFDSLLTLAYPQDCHACGNSVENSADGVACRACWSKTTIFSGGETLCHKCGFFLKSQPTDFQTFCHRCDDDFYDFASAVGVYENALAVSVLHLKREPFIAARMRELFLSRFHRSNFLDATLIVPVPLSKKRRLERGFNQAAVLSEILAREIKLKIDEQSLVRQIDTPMHRAGMDAKARTLSVKNAFQVARPNLIKGEKVLLLDDVYTTGATVSNCAKVLKENGAEAVYVFTLARTL